MLRVNYFESLCGLLHDVGKPLQRYAQRVLEGFEKRDEAILGMISELKTHEKIGAKVVKEIMGIDMSLCGLFRHALKYADRIAAAERGLGGYLYLADKWKYIESNVLKATGVAYGHTTAPSLSPLWILTQSEYANSVGPCLKDSFSAEIALRRLREHLIPLLNALDKEDVNGISKTLSELLSALKDEPLWFSPRPLTSDNLRELKALTYSDAKNGIDYLSISRHIVKGLRLVKELYNDRFTRGYVDTVNELLKYTLLTVPAAVYLALLPDTSLYSHSRIVAAYSSALSLGVKKFKLLVVDARRIQEFVASPVVAKAASRVVRGRSFLVELLSISLLNYLLELYGGLPYTNVVTSEGGTLSIIVPAWDDARVGSILGSVTNVVMSTYKRLRGLWFTVAISRDFGLEDTDVIENLKKCEETTSGELRCSGFLDLLEDLSRKLAIEKTIDDARSALNIDEEEIAGYDAITREPVTRRELEEGYGLRVDEGVQEYASTISSGKLVLGDVISEATHLSLVAGSGLRNTVFLISVYVYKPSTNLQQAPLEPAEEEINGIVDALREYMGKLIERQIKPVELYFSKVDFAGYGFNVVFIPLANLGSLHVMISSTVPAMPILEEEVRAAVIAVSSTLKALLEKLGELVRRHAVVRVEVRAVNKGAEFIELLENKELLEVVRELFERGVDFYLGTIHTGTYHPLTLKVEKEYVGLPALVDLDAYNLIAMVKADADNLGEVKKLISFSPTRLSALSDMLSTVITCKAHLLAADYANRYAKDLKPRGPIVLYAGGDDIAFYGYWVDVLLFLGRLYTDVFNALYPLSFTSAMVLERGDYPLLDLYSKVTRTLDEGKREARGWVFLAEIASPKPVTCGSKVRITSGMQPTSTGIYAQGFQPITPLELYTSLTSLLEKLEDSPRDREKVSEYKRELMIISRIAALNEIEVETFRYMLEGAQMPSAEALYDLTRRLVAFSYVSARREKEFEELSKALSGILGSNVEIHHRSGENVSEALRRAVCSKTLIDILLLYLNPYSTQMRSSF